MFARGKLLDVARKSILQGVESLSDVAPQRLWQSAQLLASFLADQEGVSHARIGVRFATCFGLARFVCHSWRPPGRAGILSDLK